MTDKQSTIQSNILLPLLEDSYRQEYTEWNRKNLRFSDAGAGAEQGEACERQIFYDLYQPNDKTSLTTASLVLFDDGRLHEQDIRRRLRLILRSPEKELYDSETQAKGKIDNTIYLNSIRALLPEEISQTLTEDPGLEIKTVNEYQFQEMARSKRILQKYYDQVQYYLFNSGKAFFFVIIKNRNTLGEERGKAPFLEFMVFPDKARQKEIRIGLLTLKKAFEERVLPARPFMQESSQCQFCRFKHLCWGELLKSPMEPVFQPDKTILQPSQEVLESAMRVYAELSMKIKELTQQQEEVQQVIENYFKATGSTEVIVGNIHAKYSPIGRVILDETMLRDVLTAQQYIAISKPQIKLIERAIENRLLDASLIEEAKKTEYDSYRLFVRSIATKTARIAKKEEVQDDKGTQPSAPMPEDGSHPARDKSTRKRKTRRHKTKRGRIFRSRSKDRQPEAGSGAAESVP